jgi:hypothetical protein
MDASSRNKRKIVSPAVQRLDEVIAAVSASGLQETASLLRIARLDLLVRLHGIAAEELELLTSTLACNGAKPKKEAGRRSLHRPGKRRSADRRGGKMPQIRR